MKFNWIIGEDSDEKLKKYCIDMEYRLRPRIMKFLIEKLDDIDCCSDFSCFYFDIDVVCNRVTVSSPTPQKYLQIIKADFEREIGFY
ncbi:hypothetical protein [Costertonia aggregata]|uniref:Uncharacterized protein n=1 Tax=Costertonia aggregata TaxID=343403 RepID=A0A7H9ARV4_9FLAO|nr:hypothetical protein [Costertonia aggregata]QLG46156.1 hypothetical protein HYG79_12625 [Costertonia aggregata]